MRINHNILALNNFNNMKKNSKQSDTSMEKLSSGLRINKSADDAAGLAISEKMRGQIRGLEQATRNSQDGISLIQVAESGLAQIENPNLQRIRELAVQAANDTLNQTDRKAIQEEVEQIKQNINHIANQTNFNGINLLNKKVQQASNETVIISSGKPASIIARHWLPSSFQVKSGVSDTFTFTINDESKTIVIDEGTYNRDEFLKEINFEFQKNDFILNASYVDGTSQLKFTAPEGKIRSLSGNGVDTWMVAKALASSSTISTMSLPSLEPGVEIKKDLNDTLTFNIGSKSYSIILTPGTYTVYKGNQSDLNINSPLLKEINNRLEEVGAPASVSFIYYGNPDEPFNDGTGLIFSIGYDHNRTNLLEAGNYTFGNFGGSAKSSLLDKFVQGWTISDSSGVISGSIETFPAIIFGEADLSEGLMVEQGLNNELNIDINGITKSITLTAGDYSATALLDEINSQFSANSIELRAVYNSLNQLNIEQTNPYDLDEIDNVSGNAMLDLLFNIKQGEAPITETTIVPSEGLIHIQNGPNGNNYFLIELTDVRPRELGIESIDLNSRKGAERAIIMVDEALKKVSSSRGKFGSYQNRLDYTINNLNTSTVNLTAAESRIRDVDLAKEMMNQTKESILAQASQAMLAQANQKPQAILQLLQ